MPIITCLILKTSTRSPTCKMPHRMPVCSFVQRTNASQCFLTPFERKKCLEITFKLSENLTLSGIFAPFFLNCAFLYKFCDISCIMRFVAILGQLCEIATSHNIRSPAWSSIACHGVSMEFHRVPWNVHGVPWTSMGFN